MTVTAMPPRGRSRWAELSLVEVDFEDPPTEAETVWVTAAPFRAHVRLLIVQSGLPWRTLAMLAEVPTTGMDALLHGRSGRAVTSIHPLLARRLYDLTIDSIADAGRHQVSAAESRALLQRLIAHGWSADRLAERTGLFPGQLSALAGGDQPWISRLTAATLRAAGQVLLAAAPRILDPDAELDEIGVLAAT